MATEISPGLERTLTSLAVAGGTTIHLTKPDGRFLRINKTGRALACYGSGHFIKNGQQATRPHQLPIQDIVSTDAATRTELQPATSPYTTPDRNKQRSHRLLLALSLAVLVGGVSVASAISSYFPKPAPEIATSTLTIDATQPDTTLETRESAQEPSSEPLETVSLPPLSISVKTPEPTQAPESKEPADRTTTRSHHAPTTAPRPEPAPTSAPRPTVQPAPTKKPEPTPEPARQLPSARVNGMLNRPGFVGGHDLTRKRE